MIKDFYTDRTILITGATGFLGKSLLAKILRDLGDVRKIYVLIRPKISPDGSVVPAHDRLDQDCFDAGVFDRLREADAERFDQLREKVAAASGDIMLPELGLEPATRDLLQLEVDLIINSAATVEFDAPLDFSLQLNTLGPQQLLKFARGCHRPVTLLQVSTAYVNGIRSGEIPEEPLPGDKTIKQLVREAETGAFDPEQEVRDCHAACESIRERALSEGQRELHRRQILAQSRSRRLPPRRLEKLVEDRCKNWLEKELVREGMRRAKVYGWNDIYTFTKAMGEQLLVANHGNLPLIIVRPSVIESSLKDPEPGWISGLKVSDPLIVAYGRGLVPDFPARKKSIMDLIPVDLVVNSIVAAAARGAGSDVPVYHVASSGENPLTNIALFRSIQSHFRENPMRGRDGEIRRLPEWSFPSRRRFKAVFHAKYIYPLGLLQWMLKRLPSRLVPASRKRSLVALKTRLQRVLYYTDLFSPYTHLDCRFQTTRTRELFESLPAEEQALFDMDVTQIDWADYYARIHLPGLRRHVLREEAEGEAILNQTPEEAGAEETRWHEEETIETIPDLLASACARYGTKVALQMERAGTWERITYAEIARRTERLAALWMARGLAPDDTVLLVGSSSPEWVIAYMAASSCGITVVPLDPQTALQEIRALLDFTEAKAVAASPNLLAQLEGSQPPRNGANRASPAQGLPQEVHRIRLEPGLGEGISLAGQMAKLPRVTPDLPASIIFTSGPIVEPRGAILTHGNFIANLFSLVDVQRVEPEDQILSVLPLYHSLEFTGGLLMSILGGATTTYLETLNSRTILRAIRSNGTTALMGVPRLFKLLADRVKRLDSADDLSTLRLVVCGGAHLSSELYEIYQALGITLCQGYGLTEAGPVVAVNPADRTRVGSVGQPLPGQSVTIDLQDGEQVGEVLVKGANVMQGYFNMPEITMAAFKDGWLRTGDIGFLDDDDYLFITGRCKNMIVTGAGQNIYAEEVEARYAKLPNVAELAVVGVHSTRTQGEEVHGVAVLERSESPILEETLAEEIRGAANQLSRSLPAYSRVQHLHLWQRPLPRDDEGDVDRLALASELALRPEELGGSDMDSSIPRWERQVYEDVSRISGLSCREVLVHSEVPLDTILDSLMGVEFTACLEQRLGEKIAFIDRSRRSLRSVVEDIETRLNGNLESFHTARVGGDGLFWSRSLSRKQPGGSAAWRRLLQSMLWSSGRSLFSHVIPFEVGGVENLPQDRPYLMAANYVSHLDTASIFMAATPFVESLSLAASNSNLASSPLSSWLLRAIANAISLDGSHGCENGLWKLRAMLGVRRPILLFPEGRRSSSGQLLPFKSGVGLLALELDVPIVPVHVSGTKGRWFGPRRWRQRTIEEPIRLLFGKPIEMARYKERHTIHRYEVYRMIAEELRREIEELAARNRGTC